MFKKIISLSLCISLVLSSVSLQYANENQGKDEATENVATQSTIIDAADEEDEGDDELSISTSSDADFDDDSIMVSTSSEADDTNEDKDSVEEDDASGSSEDDNPVVATKNEVENFDATFSNEDDSTLAATESDLAIEATASQISFATESELIETNINEYLHGYTGKGILQKKKGFKPQSLDDDLYGTDDLPAVYDAIKNASLLFDDSDHLIEIAKPKVVIVLNWNEGTDWFVSDKTDYNYYKINDHLFYYYKRSTQTHIFQTHHPRSIAMRFGFESVVNELLEQFTLCNIWEDIPKSIDDLFVKEPVKHNWLLRNELIADLASALIKSHSVMCGQQLVDILNINGITKDNGEAYVHGRGIYKPIKAAWDYYHNQLGDEQTAYNIAMAFVNANGEYAYD